VVTCRPSREGGRFEGSETSRLARLAHAADLGCAFVDVEWDSLEAFAALRPQARVLASRHWHNGMPPDLVAEYERLRARAAAVKLVGLARRASDVLPVLRLLAAVEGPVVAIAMGASGAATRALAPCFKSCLLTYAAADTGSLTAPGQLTIGEMSALVPALLSRPRLHLYPAALTSVGRPFLPPPATVALPVDAGEAAVVAAGLQQCLPRVVLTADASLGLALPQEAA